MIMWRIYAEYEFESETKTKPNRNTFQHEQHEHAVQKLKTNAARNSIASDSFVML